MRDLMAGSSDRLRLVVRKTIPWKYSSCRRKTFVGQKGQPDVQVTLMTTYVPATRLFCSRRFETSVIRVSKNTSASSINTIAFHMAAYCRKAVRLWSISETWVPSSPLHMINKGLWVYSETDSAHLYHTCPWRAMKKNHQPFPFKLLLIPHKLLRVLVRMDKGTYDLFGYIRKDEVLEPTWIPSRLRD